MSAGFDLRSLFVPPAAAAAPAPTPAGAPRPPGAAGPEDALRLRLAVRGWTEPGTLIDPPKKGGLEEILGKVSQEVETAVATQPGKWYLSLPARAREFARCSDTELRAAAAPRSEEDKDDPFRQALQLTLAATTPKLATIETPVLAGLADLAQWMGPRWPEKYGRDEIRIELANRALSADLRKMTEYPLVGGVHKKTLETLRDFATAPGHEGVSAVYVHGGGGAGKTTLLAFLQSGLASGPAPVPVARIDFDDPAIDPNRSVTLNLALFEQLLRAVPLLQASRPGILASLRQTGLIQSRAAIAQGSSSGPRRKQSKMAQTVSYETTVSESASDEGSILFGALAPEVLGGPLLIIFDTAELVLAHSDRVAKSLEDWIDFLGREAGANDLRLIIAGRDPPPDAGGEPAFASRNLLARLAASGAQMHETIALPELEPEESATLLRNCGVEDDAVVTAAAAAVPGNPLLLRITADAIGQGDADVRDAVLKAHRDSRIDPQSARRYLMRRIVAHVADPEARPYVLAAMYSPFVNRALLEQVVIPAVDRGPAEGGLPRGPAAKADARRKAARILTALSAANWLTRPTLDLANVRFNRDLRAFILKLMAATPEAAAQERDLRQSAAIFHLRRSGAEDKAMAYYHLALLGWPVLPPRDKARRRELLRDVLDELPGEVRSTLEEPVESMAAGDAPPDEAEAAAEAGPARMSDSDWLLYLEGDGTRDGEGEKMVKGDHGREALDLYESRPTRPPGLPPTFVIQALADLGKWESLVVDIEHILQEEAPAWRKSGISRPDILSRVYWVTRLALQARQGVLSPFHIDLLEELSHSVRGPGLSMLPALIAIAEAVAARPIMSPQMRENARKSEAAGRIFLAAREPQSFSGLNLQESQLVVAQKDWNHRAGFFLDTNAFSRLASIQSRLEKLQGRPMAEVNQLFDSLRDSITLHRPFPEQEGAILLMRGMTVEFHRPLREALLTFCDDGFAGPKTQSILGPTLEAMSIRPAEMDPEIFYGRLEVNPRAWCTAFVSYADRCRLLPGLCAQLRHLRDDPKSMAVGRAFVAWDQALCKGGSSDWQAGRAAS